MDVSLTADRALSVLIELAEGGRSATGLVAALGISRTAVQRLLVTLQSRALIRRSGDGTWVLSPGVLALTSAPITLVTGWAQPHLNRLPGATLLMNDGIHAVVVARSAALWHEPRATLAYGSSHPITGDPLSRTAGYESSGTLDGVEVLLQTVAREDGTVLGYVTAPERGGSNATSSRLAVNDCAGAIGLELQRHAVTSVSF